MTTVFPEKYSGRATATRPALRRLDRGAGGAQEIGAAVGVARLAVEDAARAEGAVGRLRHRADERAGPQPLGRRRAPHRSEQRRLAIDPLLLGRRRRHERLVDRSRRVRNARGLTTRS